MTPPDIRAIVRLAGVSQNEFADGIGFSRPYVSQIVNGHRTDPSIKFALRVVAFCLSRGLDDMAAKIQRRIESAVDC